MLRYSHSLVYIIIDLHTITCIMHTWAIYLHECIVTVFILKVRILSFNCFKKKKEDNSYITEAFPVLFFIWKSKRKLLRVMFSARIVFLHHVDVLFRADNF